jgi:hypothetical protein
METLLIKIPLIYVFLSTKGKTDFPALQPCIKKALA